MQKKKKLEISPSTFQSAHQSKMTALFNFFATCIIKQTPTVTAARSV